MNFRRVFLFLFGLMGIVASPVFSEDLPPIQQRILDKKNRELDERWSSSFVGFRAALGTGMAWLPGAGLDSNTPDLERVFQIAPYLGLEAGYFPGQWGAGFSVDFSPLEQGVDGSVFPSYHLVFSIYALYRPSLRSPLRWNLGISFWSGYWLSFSSNQFLLASGLGSQLKGGLAYRLSSREDKWVWEWFTQLGVDQYSRVQAGYGSQTGSYAMSQFVGEGQFSGSVMILTGLQLTTAW